MWSYTYTDELYHHGILGQKWGVRRYQNTDGSLTPAGVRRLKKLEAKEQKLAKKKSRITGEPVSSKREISKYEGMTNDELQYAINRLILENRYAELTKPVASVKKEKSRGQKLVDDLFFNALDKGGRRLTDELINAGAKKIFNNQRKTEKFDLDKIRSLSDVRALDDSDLSKALSRAKSEYDLLVNVGLRKKDDNKKE